MSEYTQCPHCKKHLLQKNVENHLKNECEKLKQIPMNLSDVFKNDYTAENGAGLQNIKRDREYWNSFARFFTKGPF